MTSQLPNARVNYKLFILFSELTFFFFFISCLSYFLQNVYFCVWGWVRRCEFYFYKMSHRSTRRTLLTTIHSLQAILNGCLRFDNRRQLTVREEQSLKVVKLYRKRHVGNIDVIYARGRTTPRRVPLIYIYVPRCETKGKLPI